MPRKVADPGRIVIGTAIADPTRWWSCQALWWSHRWSAGPAFVGTPAGTAAGHTEHDYGEHHQFIPKGNPGVRAPGN